MTYASELYWGEVALHICAVNGEASTLPMTRPSLPRLTTPHRLALTLILTLILAPTLNPRFTLILLTLTPRV